MSISCFVLRYYFGDFTDLDLTKCFPFIHGFLSMNNAKITLFSNQYSNIKEIVSSV